MSIAMNLDMRQTVASKRHYALIATLIITMIGGLPAAGEACSIPVFRYALEHWAPDSYRITLFHDAPLSAAQVTRLQDLQRHCESANAIMKQVSVSEDMDEATQQLWESLRAPQLPAVVVQLPSSSQGAPLVWSGALDELQASSLFTSPTRTQVVRALEGGESAVWVFLESGDKTRDDQLFSLLETEVTRLQQSLKLEPIEAADLAELSGSPTELQIKFSCVRVSRTDPAEAQTVNMLLSVEQDLREEELVNEPMVFPVFGRGRALYALIGDGISSSIIDEAARFLIGGCQCTVKVQNPGTDLLLTAGWETYVAPAEPVPPEYIAIPNASPGVAANNRVASPEPNSALPASEPAANESTTASAAKEVLNANPSPIESPIEQRSAPASDHRGFPYPLAIIFILGGLMLIGMQWVPRSDK